MTHEARPPLDDEERTLARRLARLDAASGPSPALDARVLAHAAGEQTAGRRPRTRWAAGVGLAASVVLAAGLALQLRPPGPADGGDEAPHATAAGDLQAMTDAPRIAGAEAADTVEGEEPSAPREPPGAADSVERVAPVPPPADAGDAPAPPGPADRDARRQRAATAAASAMDPGAGAPRSPAESRGNTLADVQAQSPPAAPAPPAPAAAAPAVQGKSAARTDAASEADMAPPASGPAREDGARTGGTFVAHDEPFDEAPPASADSPAVRRAWLERIHELVAAGERDAARASLQEFHRRYPSAVIPEDLRDLLP